jgi:hypothetical protein
MGNYINHDSKGKHLGASFESKLKNLIADGAKEIPTPIEWNENLVCVVDNGPFAAAGHAYDEREMKAFISGMSGRKYQWLEYEHASLLAQ